MLTIGWCLCELPPYPSLTALSFSTLICKSFIYHKLKFCCPLSKYFLKINHALRSRETIRNKTHSISALMGLKFEVLIREINIEQGNRLFLRNSKCFQRVLRTPRKIKWGSKKLKDDCSLEGKL